MSARNTIKAILVHFLVTTILLVTEIGIELVLHWNPSHIEDSVLAQVIRACNWFLVGTVSQFCLLAFLLILIESVEEVIERVRAFVDHLRRKPPKTPPAAGEGVK